MEVEYYTNNGWSHYTTYDDRLFHPLLESYEDLDVDLPSRIELRGSVASVIEQQWPVYERLKKYMAYVERSSANISKGNRNKKKWMNKYTTNDMLNVMFGSRNSFFIPPIPVYLDEIESLSRILNLPRGWEAFVIARGVTPEERRLHHLIAQGRSMAEEAKKNGVDSAKEYIGVIPPGDLGADFFVQQALRATAYEEINRLKKNEERASLMSDILFGVIRTSVLNAYSAGRRLMWNDVPWGDLDTLLVRHANSKILTQDRAVVKLFAGRGGSNERLLSKDIVVWTSTGLYDRLLLSYDEEGDQDLIQSVSLHPPSLLKQHNLADYVQQKNINLVRQYVGARVMRGDRDELESEYALHIVRLMYYTTPGREGVIRLLLAALRLMEKGEKGIVEEIANAAEVIIAEAPEDRSGRIDIDKLSNELLLSIAYG